MPREQIVRTASEGFRRAGRLNQVSGKLRAMLLVHTKDNGRHGPAIARLMLRLTGAAPAEDLDVVGNNLGHAMLLASFVLKQAVLQPALDVEGIAFLGILCRRLGEAIPTDDAMELGLFLPLDRSVVGTEEALVNEVNDVRGRIGAAYHACPAGLSTRTTQLAADLARLRTHTHFPSLTPTFARPFGD